ncbi:Pyruvate/2-oxoglutarate dehydrogenase complex dihydrolipoamide acyltransferase (E2) protein-like protein [Conexibacter woesei DSM 14684]|uniref:Pyruvate/2-oxoglutarate dehydrogenase complex dihydrolipoamide acyltransferase (E2) protein-like protein n=1 Tax=Conexibacter woesei (strain DSM 14684 / CCUG 47730 / CIP 108061 / JCM 11494 / NBRC 100937 / ID131577) TaxID=469383 RepID=D3F0Q4_CONWI|nr:Pyruvate/2-oxoglutarate dehydrogenase complex dihydrolipoamide acyltransferase (E2) protein-like protein [Conexibacter woesei DSM 14684]
MSSIRSDLLRHTYLFRVLQRVDGEIVDRTLMTLTLSCDHRILYGADAALFLNEINQLIEAPLGMAL